jgi:SecD/SecF fusion protein
MQNRSLLWIFIILLTLSVAYLLSFSFIAKNYENTVKQAVLASLGDSIDASDPRVEALYNKALRDSADAVAFPMMGYSYSYLKQHEINLGLDLRGGMSVTLEVSIPDLIIALSDYNSNPTFTTAIENAKKAQLNSTSDFITLFESEWKKLNNGQTQLWRIFNNPQSQDKFPVNMSDDDVIKALRKEANDAIDNTENIIRKRIDQFGVTQPNVQKQALSSRIIVELPGVSDQERVRKNLKSTANLEFWNTYFNVEIAQAMVNLNEALGKIKAPELYGLNAVKTDSTGAIIPDTTKAGAVKPNDQLTEDEKKRKNPLFALLSLNVPQDNQTPATAVIGFAQATNIDEISKILRSELAKSILPKDLRLLWGAKAEKGTAMLYAIKADELNGRAPLDGKSITDARQDFDPVKGGVVVEMSMSPDVGAPKWREMTKKNAADNHRAVAVVMDSVVYSAPSVNEEIPNGKSVITFGSGDNRDKQILEAKDLAGLLKAGSLPAPARIIDEVVVGPQLGEENIKAGVYSFIGAFILILIYMVFYYAWAGWAANVALIANLFFLIGALVSLGGTLTLPGIAGIVLTMGMAVDANVLIYERVKEELRMGKPISAAMREGFLKAISAIVDGNATTLITGLVLLFVGTGPIKGFATTLIIGIFTTLFTAIIISRLILYRRLESKKEITFYSSITKNWFTKMNFDFVTKRYIYYSISAIIIIAGAISWTTRGFNMGVDFAGGSSFKVKFEEKADAEALRNSFSTYLVNPDGNKASTTVQAIGSSGSEFKITTNYLVNESTQDSDAKVRTAVDEALNKVGKHEITSSYKVDATMSDDFRAEAYWSAIIALVLVGVYVVFRFRKVDFAIGATVALFHDALMVIAAFTLLNGLVPFTLEVNQNFIGAILTVIGYSINDTVVIFDRIREYFRERRNPELKSTINDALNSTLGRSINTSMTVLLTLIVMFIFGSDDIKGFCFAMIVGVVSGVYSTLFIATPIVVDMRKMFGKKQEA